MKRNIQDIMQVELTSAEGARALSVISSRDIEIFSLTQSGELTVRFWVRRRDYGRLRSLCEKRGDSLTLMQKRGLYWTFLGLLRRPVLVWGLLFLSIFMMYLPSRVLFVRVEGNQKVPARQILVAAENCGVGFGASRRYVRSEKVKNALLGAIPELGWAGVNTSGCTAVISVRERNTSGEEKPLGSIVADRDGYILSADITRGTALVGPGQTVRKGEMLVSGYTDCGLCIRATGAEGEIFARTRRNLKAVTPVNRWERTGSGTARKKYSLIFRKKRINLWKDSGICDATCGRMYKEFYITLPGGFQLPFGVGIETQICGELRSVEETGEYAQETLCGFAERYLTGQMVSGTITQRMQAVSRKDGLYLLEGTYDCTEMIGRGLEIGETNGKRD